MRWGVRLQLLVVLAAAMVVGFVPLFFATSTYTRVALEKLQHDSAVRVARSVATQLSDERSIDASRTDASSTVLQAKVDDLIAAQAVHAMVVFDMSGQALAGGGTSDLNRELHPSLASSAKAPTSPEASVATRVVRLRSGQTLITTFSDNRGSVVMATRIDRTASRARDLSGLVGIYSIIAALTVLVLAYFALTRWIIRPVLQLERSAERVADGARRMAPLKQGPAELIRLSHSLSRMTDRLRDEEEALREKIDEVERATEELKSAQASLVRSERLASVGRLAAGLAHEVGNPLSALMGMQELLLDPDLSREEHDDFLERMKKETTRIHRVLSDLLAFARPAASPSLTRGANELIGSGQRELGRASRPGDVAAVISDLVALLSPQTDFKDVQLITQIDSKLPRVVLESEELTQVLLNLIMNAGDAIQREGHIEVIARPSDAGVSIRITDDGPGVDPEIASTLFEPFVSTKEVGKGTGLGLSVSRGLVEAVDGSLELDSTFVDGARFVIRLPAVHRD